MPREREEIQQLGLHRRWRRGGVLCTEGERAGSVAVLLSGRVKIVHHTADGTQILLAVRGAGSLIGELSALDGRPRVATVVALEPVEARVLPAAQFVAFLEAHGRVALLLARMLTERLRDSDLKRVEYGTRDTTDRVIGRLVELAERFGEQSDTGVRITLELSQEELAGWAGASREAVCKALATLRSRGLIQTGRRAIAILDLDALRRRAQDC